MKISARCSRVMLEGVEWLGGDSMNYELFVADYVKAELLVLIPVLYFVGVMLKRTKLIDDTLIPALLGVCGVLMALVWVTGTGGLCAQSVFVGITQGILCAGCSVYVNQLVVQAGKVGAGGEEVSDGH